MDVFSNVISNIQDIKEGELSHIEFKTKRIKIEKQIWSGIGKYIKNVT